MPLSSHRFIPDRHRQVIRYAVPMVVAEVLRGGEAYRAFKFGANFEVHTKAGGTLLEIGDFIVARFVKAAQELFLPTIGIPPVMIAAAINITGASNDPLRFAYTKNILATSPVWVENSLGLPTDSDAAINLFGDGSTEYLIEDDPAAAGTDWRMWRNIDPLGTGVWELVLDQAMINAALGQTHTTTLLHAPAARVAAGGSIVYVLIETEDIDKDYLAHSHDRGASWTIIELPNGGNRNFYSMVVGFANPNLLYIYGAVTGGSSLENVVRSLDGGHSFDFRSVTSPNTRAAFIGMPKTSNPSENIVFLGRGSIPTASLARSIDGANTFSAWSTESHLPLFSQTNALSMWETTGRRVFRSINQGITYDFVDIGIGGATPYAIYDTILYKDNLMVVTGLRAVVSGVVTGPAIWSSTDKITWTGRDGNLDTAFYYNLQVGQRPSPAVDFHKYPKQQVRRQ